MMIEKLLSEYSESFCLAKYYRTNLRLDSGLTSSCHHCPDEHITNDLTNTNQAIQDRIDMREGKYPSSCSYCWNMEKQGLVSDRITKSNMMYRLLEKTNRLHELHEIYDGKVISDPLYLELSFDNICNFQCVYCTPNFSSKWESDIKNNGAYPTKTKRSLGLNKHSHYDSFMDKRDEYKTKLGVVRITGGEPLLYKNFFNVLDLFKESNIQLMVNSNLNPPHRNYDRFINEVNKIDNFHLYTSFESTGKNFEFTRYGSDWNQFKSNMIRYLDETTHTLHIMAAHNAYSILDFDNFIHEVKELKDAYPKRVFVNSHLVRYPSYMDVAILEGKIQLSYDLELSKVEKQQLDHVIMHTNNPISFGVNSLSNDELVSDFKAFVNEFCKRKGIEPPKHPLLD